MAARKQLLQKEQVGIWPSMMATVTLFTTCLHAWWVRLMVGFEDHPVSGARLLTVAMLLYRIWSSRRLQLVQPSSGQPRQLTSKLQHSGLPPKQRPPRRQLLPVQRKQRQPWPELRPAARTSAQTHKLRRYTAQAELHENYACNSFAPS